MAKEQRFYVDEYETGRMMVSAQVLTDSETGVQYLFVQSGYGGGVTVLVGADGKPLLNREHAHEE